MRIPGSNRASGHIFCSEASPSSTKTHNDDGSTLARIPIVPIKWFATTASMFLKRATAAAVRPRRNSSSSLYATASCIMFSVCMRPFCPCRRKSNAYEFTAPTAKAGASSSMVCKSLRAVVRNSSALEKSSPRPRIAQYGLRRTTLFAFVARRPTMPACDDAVPVGKEFDCARLPWCPSSLGTCDPSDRGSLRQSALSVLSGSRSPVALSARSPTWAFKCATRRPSALSLYFAAVSTKAGGRSLAATSATRDRNVPGFRLARLSTCDFLMGTTPMTVESTPRTSSVASRGTVSSRRFSLYAAMATADILSLTASSDCRNALSCIRTPTRVHPGSK
eukprot:Opistho-2@76893